ncbi:MAG: hypothetical protein N2663_07570 [Chlorobi bacterium]|nr:hypothetical protein [Chlorobiota bacterium]
MFAVARMGLTLIAALALSIAADKGKPNEARLHEERDKTIIELYSNGKLDTIIIVPKSTNKSITNRRLSKRDSTWFQLNSDLKRIAERHRKYSEQYRRIAERYAKQAEHYARKATEYAQLLKRKSDALSSTEPLLPPSPPDITTFSTPDVDSLSIEGKNHPFVEQLNRALTQLEDLTSRVNDSTRLLFDLQQVEQLLKSMEPTLNAIERTADQLMRYSDTLYRALDVLEQQLEQYQRRMERWQQDR